MLVPQGEWERDRQGLPAMTGPVFFDAACEMVDQWSPSVKASDIGDLQHLHQACNQGKM
jgi:hypothetical protein